MKLKSYKTLWGMPGPLDAAFRRIAEAGYDGTEIQLPADARVFKRLLKKYGLEFIPILSTQGRDWREHAQSFESLLKHALPYASHIVTAHSGSDLFSPADQVRYMETVLAIASPYEERLGIRVCHETHRTRILVHPREAGNLLRQFPELRLVADFSHWTVVCMSLMEDQPDTMALACERAWHFHSRVGSDNAPQVADPRAPEFAAQVAAQDRWWDTILAAQRGKGRAIMTCTQEYGPPSFQATLPYTGQPVADIWDICLHEHARFKARFALAEEGVPDAIR